MVKMKKLLIIILISLLLNPAFAATHYIREGGTGNGTAWNNAWDDWADVTWTRGDTYYVADGNYSGYTFTEPESTTLVITIKKATAADHGDETGWLSAYGDGQAVLSPAITFEDGYYVLDGNGTHTIPSNTSSDYGFKINSNSYTNNFGILRFGTAGNTVSNITIKYVHVYNTYHATNSGWGPNNCNQTVGLRFYPSLDHTYIKVQNSYLQNSGKDGIQLSSTDYFLLERSYIERYGKRLECGAPYNDHGQTVQMFWGTNNLVYRWNIWESNEGEALLSHSDSGTTNNIRFYGNVIFHPYGAGIGLGYNNALFGNQIDWFGSADNWYIYNNTWVHQRDSYAGTTNDFENLGATATDFFHYNDLIYDCESFSHSASYTYSHGASGGLGTFGGASEQTGLSSTIFNDYTNDDFTLSGETTAGIDLTNQPWWDDCSGTPCPFFVQLDYNTDMYNNIRGGDGVLDRGAYEFGIGSPLPNIGPQGTHTFRGGTIQ
jgi:hypothetical protein